jgi:hypothetical protein
MLTGFHLVVLRVMWFGIQKGFVGSAVGCGRKTARSTTAGVAMRTKKAIQMRGEGHMLRDEVMMLLGHFWDEESCTLRIPIDASYGLGRYVVYMSDLRRGENEESRLIGIRFTEDEKA